MQRRSIRLGLTVILPPIAAMALFAQGQGQGRGRGPQAPARPTPRIANGRVNLGPPPGELGLWLPVDARLSVPDVGVGRGAGGAAPAMSETVTAGEKSLPLCSYPTYPKYNNGPVESSSSYACSR